MAKVNIGEQRYRVLIDNAPDAVLLLDVASGRFIDANRAAVGLLKFPREELLQLGPSDISPAFYKGGAAVTRVQAYIERTLNGGNPVFECVHVDRNGHEVPCEIRLIRFPPYGQSIIKVSIVNLTDKKQLEAKLAEREDRLKLALKATGLGCYDWYPQGNPPRWDTGMYELFGLDPLDPIDRKEYFFQVLHPEDKEENFNKLQYIMDPKSGILTFKNKYRIIRHGDIAHLISTGTVVRAENGEVQRLIGTVQDVTERIKANEQLKNQATLLNKVSDAVIVTDASFVILSWNKAAEKMYGWTTEEATCQRLSTLVPTIYVDERREEVAAHFFEKGIWQGEVIQQDKEGKVLYVWSSVTALKDAKGKMTGSIGVNRDISDRKQMELALRESEARYKSLVQHFPNGVISLIDQDLRYTLIDGERKNKLNIDHESLIGKRLRDAYPKEKYEQDEPFQRSALQGKKLTRIVSVGSVYYSVTTLPVRDESGAIISCLEVSQDITTLIETEQKLKETLQQLQLAIQTAKLGIFRFVLANDQLIGNDQLLEMYGIDPSQESLSWGVWRSKIHPEDRDKTQQDFVKSLRGNHLAKSTFRAILPGGSVRHIQGAASPIFNAQGELIEFVGINIDITSIKKNEEALQEEEAFHRAIYENNLNAVLVADDQGNLRSFNQATCRILGYPEAELTKMNLTELPLKNIPNKKRWYREILRKGKAIGELVIVPPDQPVRVTQYYAIHVKEDFNLCVLADITQRKEMEEKLQDREERFQVSTRAAQFGIWDWKIEKNHLRWDETMMKIYGLTNDQFPNSMKAWKRFLLPEDIALFRKMVDWKAEDDKEFSTEFRIQRADGEIRYIKAATSIQRDETGTALSMIGANWDVTQEKEAEQERIRTRQLELRNRELEQFAYVASHDLQEPLRTVISFVGLLKRKYSDKLDESANEYIQFVIDASSRMSQLIRGLLDYSRIGVNRAVSLVDSAILVQQSLQDLSAQISKTSAVIEVAPLPKINGYGTELRMLFQNLISNAIKFRKPDQHPVIQIGVKEEKLQWVFSVRDEGIGIDPMYSDQIFVLFQQLHGREKYEGTGIGLSHCQKIVDLHGGTIWVVSELNKGSTFFFSIAKSMKVLPRN